MEDGSEWTGREDKRQSTNGGGSLDAKFGESSNDIREVRRQSTEDSTPRQRRGVVVEGLPTAEATIRTEDSTPRRIESSVHSP